MVGGAWAQQPLLDNSLAILAIRVAWGNVTIKTRKAK